MLPGKRLRQTMAVLLALLAGTTGYLKFRRKPTLAGGGPLSTSALSQPSLEWQEIDAGTFFVSIPRGWEFHKLRGIDSYVGEITGSGTRLQFDYGSYSNPLDDLSNQDYSISFEYIHGRQAKIVFPKTPGRGMTGVYFDGLAGPLSRTAFNLAGNNLSSTQQGVALQVFRTLRFKKIARIDPSDSNPFRNANQ